VPKDFCISAFPNIPEDPSKNRTTNFGVIFREGVYCPELIDSQVRKGRKVQTDEGPKAFTAAIDDEEVKAIFFRGAEQVLSITLRITVQEPGLCTQRVPVQQPEEKLALLRRVVLLYGRGERMIRVSLKGKKVVVSRGRSFSIDSDNVRVVDGDV
jgi:hypothetical protein